MEYTISYYSDVVQAEIFGLPDTLTARYIVLTRRMVVIGPNLGAPHTKALARMHSFIKKSDKTPLHEREIAEARLKEVKHAYA